MKDTKISNKKSRSCGIAALILLICTCVAAQGRQQQSTPLLGGTVISMEEAIDLARERSVLALSAKANFVSSYWAYRSYQASRLPSLNIYGNLASFDHSLRQLQNFETGEIVYTSNYNMQNSLGLSIRQNITLTGGVISVFSDLSRIDQFGSNPYVTWYSRPLSLTYTQPIFGYNQFKWDKIISPKQYEKAKKVYVESMESVTILAVKYFFSLMMAKRNHEKAVTNFENTRKMHSIAEERMELGSITRDEYLQLELRMLNDSIAINETSNLAKEAQMDLNSLLGYDDSYEIDPVLSEELPDVQMDYDMVLDKSYRNSSFLLDNELRMLNSESDLARAKADRGISISLNANLGLSNTDRNFASSYRNLLDQEVIGFTFTIPIFDWGLGEGRVKRAVANAAVTKAEVEQRESDFRRTVFTAVGQFNNQKNQCSVSRRAAQIAAERYDIVMERFRKGSASVMDLNTARSENDDAIDRYIADLNNFWSYYFEIRRLTLFDFIGSRDIDVDYKELLK